MIWQIGIYNKYIRSININRLYTVERLITKDFYIGFSYFYQRKQNNSTINSLFTILSFRQHIWKSSCKSAKKSIKITRSGQPVVVAVSAEILQFCTLFTWHFYSVFCCNQNLQFLPCWFRTFQKFVVSDYIISLKAWINNMVKA